MSVVAFPGPLLNYGITLSSTSGDGITGQDYEHNPQRAPMYSDLGDAMQDPRQAYAYQPGSGVTAKTFGFFNNTGSVDFVPSSAALAAVVSNTGSSGVSTFTLVAGSSANGTVTTTIIAPETGKVTGSLLCIGSTAAYLTFGSAGTMATWNPGAGTGRCVSITTSSSGDAGTFSVAGRDMYGYKMTETLALSQGSSNSSGFTITGQKAFKYISSVTNTSTPTSSGITVGYADTFGFPLAAPYAGMNAQVQLLPTVGGSSAGVIALSTVTFIVPSSLSTMTSTTADVRGTYKSSTALNSAIRLQMLVTPSASAIAAITSTNVAPLFGPTQFSSV